mgnify:CR=1 FL=1
MATVTLINPFEVPPGREEECLAFWERVADYMRRQPGFISTRLHQAVAPGARFALINLAEWASAEDFQAAVGSAEFQALVGPYLEVFPHFPGLYQVVRH